MCNVGWNGIVKLRLEVSVLALSSNMHLSPK